VFRVGWLSPAGSEAGGANLDALREGLSALGYQEGRNLAIESRWADGGSEQLPTLARELINLKVDVICTAGTQATRAARGVTSTLPVIFANVAFPVQQQLVASYARPGGNVTGVAFDGAEYGKRLELLKEIVPRLARVALIYNPENQGSVLALEETRRWARSLSITSSRTAFGDRTTSTRRFPASPAVTPTP
jgi:putative ABC transport system substrate-binding protein